MPQSPNPDACCAGPTGLGSEQGSCEGLEGEDTNIDVQAYRQTYRNILCGQLNLQFFGSQLKTITQTNFYFYTDAWIQHKLQ